jgi:hypothetical protein
LSWSTVRRAEDAGIARWDRTCPDGPLHMVGVDEKRLGRRHKRTDKFVTIVSDLETGKPVWIGYGRNAATLSAWLATLSEQQKATIRLFAMDTHRPFMNAIRGDDALRHAAIVHDPFHIVKRAGEAVSELRRREFFRAGRELRAWERVGEKDRVRLKRLFSINGKLARAYQVVEEQRQVLHAPDRASMVAGLFHVLYRTEKHANVPMRKLHDSLAEHFTEIVALGEHHPPTGRIEALNTHFRRRSDFPKRWREHKSAATQLESEYKSYFERLHDDALLENALAHLALAPNDLEPARERIAKGLHTGSK